MLYLKRRFEGRSIKRVHSRLFVTERCLQGVGVRKVFIHWNNFLYVFLFTFYCSTILLPSCYTLDYDHVDLTSIILLISLNFSVISELGECWRSFTAKRRSLIIESWFPELWNKRVQRLHEWEGIHWTSVLMSILSSLLNKMSTGCSLTGTKYSSYEDKIRLVPSRPEPFIDTI